MRSRSDRLFGLTFLGLIAAVPLFVAGLRVGGVVIVAEDEVVREDLYAMGERVIVEGVVQGDLFVITGNLTVAGSVEGDVLGLVGGPVVISGEVEGSVRVAANTVSVTGTVRENPRHKSVTSKVSDADLAAIAVHIRSLASAGAGS